VTGRDSSENFEDWIPGPDDPDLERFKWGWNEVDGETVWPVGGPGDGWPAHVDQLGAAWGRKPGSIGGDVMGVAEYRPRAAEVVIGAFGARVSDAVMGWFRDAFPDAQVRVAGGE
jgi:hypothetical protein